MIASRTLLSFSLMFSISFKSSEGGITCDNFRKVVNFLDRKFTGADCMVATTNDEDCGIFTTKILFPNGSEIDKSNTGHINSLKIHSRMSPESIKFVPAVISKYFSNLAYFDMSSVGLTHLEMEDMRQFSDKLIIANFERNKLKALEADVFEFNTNLEEVKLNGNKLLSFINPVLFKNLKSMKNIKKIYLSNSNCINYSELQPKTGVCNYEKCNNASEQSENVKRIQRRKNFFEKCASSKSLCDLSSCEANPDDSEVYSFFIIICLILLLSFINLFLIFFYKNTKAKSKDLQRNIGN